MGNLLPTLSKLAVLAIVIAGAGRVVWGVVVPTELASPIAQTISIPDLSRIAETGRRAFDVNCASCHGENGSGTEQGPPLIHSIYHPGHHGDPSFHRAVREGVRRHHWNFGDMPAQPKVTERQTEAIIAFVREVQRANGIR